MSHPAEPPATPVELLRRLRQGPDPDAFAKVWGLYEPFIASRAGGAGFGIDGVAEIVQRVAIRLADWLPRFDYDPGGSFRGYLARIVRTQAADYRAELRDERAGCVAFDSSLHSPDPPRRRSDDTASVAPAPDPRRRRSERIVERVRGRVKPTTWDAFRLIELDDLPCAEAADRLGWPYFRTYRAHARVKAMLADEGRRDREAGA